MSAVNIEPQTFNFDNIQKVASNVENLINKFIIPKLEECQKKGIALVDRDVYPILINVAKCVAAGLDVIANPKNEHNKFFIGALTLAFTMGGPKAAAAVIVGAFLFGALTEAKKMYNESLKEGQEKEKSTVIIEEITDENDTPDLDDLKARFEELKKK